MKKLICLLLAFISLDGIAQQKWDDTKKIFYDNCEELPPVSWGIDYKTGYSMVTGGSQQVNNPDSRTGIKLSDQAYTGSKSYEMYVTKREDYPGCCQWVRSEVMYLAPSQQTWDNEWNYAALSVRLDPSWQYETRRTLIAYDHKESPDDLQTPWGLTVEGDQFAIGGRFSSGKKIGKAEKGKWYRFVLHRNWKSDATGFFRLYLDGKLVFEHNGPNADGRSGVAPITRIQHGLYKWVWASPSGQGEGQGSAWPGEPQGAPSAPIRMQIDDIQFGFKGGTATLADFFMDGTVTPPPPPPTPKETYKINAGGPATGEFTADQFFSGGSTYSVPSSLPVIYQSERYGNFSYAFPVPSGIYQVKLYFSEIYHTSAGARVFNVKSEGMTVLNNYDIFKDVGANAVVKSFSQPVSDGALNLSFETVTDNAKVSAIEILPYTEPPPTPTANAGPDQQITLPVNLVSLNGTGTNGNPLWSKITTLPATITNPATFTTTVTGLVAGVHEFELSVGSAKDTVRIIVLPEPTPPPVTIWVKEVRTELSFIEGALRLVVVVSYTDGSEIIIEKK